MRAITYFNRGNSFPIVLEHLGKKYLVKLREGMSGKYSILSEWFGNRVGSELGLNAQRPFWLNLQEVEVTGLHEEVRDLIEKSRGTNIGFEFMENASEVSGTQMADLDIGQYQEVFLLDIFLLNIDRSPENTNLLRANGKVWAIDYESSMLFQELLGGSDVASNPGILQCLKRNPLFQAVRPEALACFLEKVNAIDFEQLLTEVPPSILKAGEKAQLLVEIEGRKEKEWRVAQFLENAGKTTIPSRAEEKERANRNQAMFKRNMEKKTD